MIRHIVAWNFKPDAPSDAGEMVKAALEGLGGKIDGIVKIKVHTKLVGTSNRQIVLDSLLESEEALAAYQTHPAHVAAADVVKSVAMDRVCVDFCVPLEVERLYKKTPTVLWLGFLFYLLDDCQKS